MQTKVLAVLRSLDVHPSGLEQALGEAGVDSLIGMQFEHELAEAVGLPVPQHLVYAYPNAQKGAPGGRRFIF